MRFMVMVKRDNGKIDGLGSHNFIVIPRIGEYITRDEEGVGQAYRVIAVIHPLDSPEDGGDIILKYVSTDIALMMSL